jgi:hypothetical protein
VLKKLFLLLAAGIALQLSAALNVKGKFDWKSKDVKELTPGIVYVRFERKTPRTIKMAAVKVDLTNPKLRFKVTSRDKDWGKPMPGFEKKFVIRTKRQTCRIFMEEQVKNGHNMVLAVNGTPFGPWEPPWNHPYADGQGLLVDNGTLVAPPRHRRPGFIVKKDGTYALAGFKGTDDISHIKHAFSGFSQVLAKGKIIDKNDKRLAPRTGFGMPSDCKTLYILVADGRQPGYSMGLSTWEVAEMLRYLGADDGLNMDGGGSTTLYIRDKQGMRNLAHYIGGYERYLGACLGIIIDEGKDKK